MTTSTPVAVQAAAPNLGKEVLKYLGLNPDNIETHALVLLCERYRLDPLLNHAGIISTAGGKMRPYITRDGMLEIAHRSGHFDGITVDEERRNSENNGWTAYVSVWRNDMSHPFRYGAQCKDGEPQAKQGNGAEMALARAERRALRRAFNIPAYGDEPDTGDQLADIVEASAGDVTEVGGEASVPTSRPGRAETTGTDAPPADRLTDEQRDEIGRMFREIGLDTAADQLAYASGKIGRKLTGPGAMTYAEGDQLIDALIADCEPM